MRKQKPAGKVITTKAGCNRLGLKLLRVAVLLRNPNASAQDLINELRRR